MSDNIIHLAWFPVILPRSVWKLLTYLKNSVRLFFFKKKAGGTKGKIASTEGTMQL